MQHTFTLPLSTLRAALTHSSTDDVRGYLIGVCLALPCGRVVATDGRRMLVADGPCVLGAPSVIIDADSIKAVIKAYESSGAPYKQGGTLGAWPIECALECVEGATTATNITLKVPNGSIVARPIDGQYPDFKRVIPTKVDGTAGNYNAGYIQTAVTAFKMYRNKHKNDSGYNPTLVQNGLSPAVMFDNDNGMLVIVMPLRASKDVGPGDAIAACDWARSNAPADAAAAKVA